MPAVQSPALPYFFLGPKLKVTLTIKLIEHIKLIYSFSNIFHNQPAVQAQRHI